MWTLSTDDVEKAESTQSQGPNVIDSLVLSDSYVKEQNGTTKKGIAQIVSKGSFVNVWYPS